MIRSFVPVAAVQTFVGGVATADSAMLESIDGQWTYDLTAYLFAPVSTTGTTTVARTSAELDMDLQDALDVLDSSLSGRAEAWNGNFGLAFEGNYLGISDKQSVTSSGPLGAGFDADVEVEQYWLSFLGAYRFAEGMGGNGRPYAFDAQAGARSTACART